MSIYNHIAKDIILPFSDIISGTNISQELKFLEKSQYWKPRELEDYQNKKFRALIKHTYEHVPYYHNLFNSLNLKPDDLKTKESLNKLPILSKDEIRNNKDNFLARNIKKTNAMEMVTSGSSGKIFEYLIDKKVLSISRAMGLRGWEFAGYSMGDRIVTIAGSSLLSKNMNFSKKIRFKISRNYALSSYNMDNKKIKNYVQQIIKFRPKFIRGYPSSLGIIADYLLENRIQDIKLKGIMTTAETLTNRDRLNISEAFNCEVFDQCGCNDGGENLWECKEHVGYHIGVERTIHEFINEAGETVSNNENGRIILTDLWNYTMPLIRYDAGDIGVPTDEICPCGRGLPLIKSIKGRTADKIILPNGFSIPGLTITDIFDFDKAIIDRVREYQIIQEKINEFTINIVKNVNYDDESSKKICKYFEDHMGIPLEIKFNFVSDIPKTNANKRRLVISNVKKN